jgi:hypothetical protein
VSDTPKRPRLAAVTPLDRHAKSRRVVVELLEDALARAKAGQFVAVWLAADTDTGDVATFDSGAPADVDTRQRGARLIEAGIDVMVRHRTAAMYQPIEPLQPED